MHVIRREARSQCCPECIDRNRIPPHRAIDFTDETIPAAATTAFIRETDLLGVTELHALVQEHPERPVVGVGKEIKDSPIVNDTIDGYLPCIIRHRPDTICIVDDAAACLVVHIIYCLKQRPNHIRLRSIPIERRRQHDPGGVKVCPKRRCGRVADEAGDRRHLDAPLSL